MRYTRFLLSFMFLAAASCSLHAQFRFTVGTASAAPGQKATGVLEVPAGVDQATNIPVAVVNGVKPGPVLALVSGAHGTEYASIIALETLILDLDPSQLTGTVIILPLVNLPSFEQKVPHVNPVDKKSMNRFYPGKADGTQTERASYLITKEVVDRCDYLIDFHGGDLDESLRPYAYWVLSGRAQQDAVSALLAQGTLSVMRYLKMLPGDPRSIEHPVWIQSLSEISSPETGIFYPLVKRGTYVQEGMNLGYVTDYVGKILFEARAPVSGIVLHICAVPSMKKGDNIANIGVVASKAP